MRIRTGIGLALASLAGVVVVFTAVEPLTGDSDVTSPPLIVVVEPERSFVADCWQRA